MLNPPHSESNESPELTSGEFLRPDGSAVADASELATPLTGVDRSEIVKGYAKAAEKVRSFPHTSGVYLMKDDAQRVVYIGKAKNLRSRAGSYFLAAALDDSRTLPIVREVRDIDFIATESEIDAILLEARLIKDIQPKFNRDLKDDKTFPYLQVVTREPFPFVEITRQPREHGVRLFGPFPSAIHLRSAMGALQKIFKFRTCNMHISDEEEKWRHYRPCLLASIGRCTGPCNRRVAKQVYRTNILRLCDFLSGRRKHLYAELEKEMEEAARDRHYERAAEIRDQIFALKSLKERGKLDVHVQPEVFHVDPRRGVLGLQKVFHLDHVPRVIEGMDIAHLSGKETVASLVRFLDGMPFKSGYRRFRIRTVAGVDDFASMAEVVARRFAMEDPDIPPPDILLIDGGKGQLHAALGALEHSPTRPGMIISLAKKEEEVFVPGQADPIRLSRHSFALRLLQYVRDESHRFAQHYHHLLRDKSTLQSGELVAHAPKLKVPGASHGNTGHGAPQDPAEGS
ncbi:MAG: excinuclease ABC subunit UvrC [Planctomycetia bacterium]|nr:excinuclease ABC subunit UvrC [Planctomycetia bacterium]